MTHAWYPENSHDIHETNVFPGQPALYDGVVPGRLREYEVVVLGGGSAAEELCAELARSQPDGRVPFPIAVIERQRVGGICPFVACMPSKAMLAAARDARREGAEPLPYSEATSRRDDVAEHFDDAGHEDDLTKMGVDVIRGRATITGPNALRVRCTDRCMDWYADQPDMIELSWRRLVVATGSVPAAPAIPGLDDIGAWTSDEALTARELPERIAILGGGPVGCELAEIFATWLGPGAVTLIESEDCLLCNEEPEVGDALEGHFEDLGVALDLGTDVERAARAPDGRSLLYCSDGATIEVDRVIVATGRRPATEDLGLDSIGVTLDDDGTIEIDDCCRSRSNPDVLAAGDVTGVAPFTHTANYQGRIVAAGLLERPRAADYRAVPRCVYTSPPAAAVGMTRRQAAERGIDVESVCIDLAETARASVEGIDSGVLVLIADRNRQILVGASAIGPRADEWIGQLTLAVRIAAPLTVLADLVHPFPTYSEAVGAALRRLLGSIVAGRRLESDNGVPAASGGQQR